MKNSSGVRTTRSGGINPHLWSKVASGESPRSEADLEFRLTIYAGFSINFFTNAATNSGLSSATR